MKCPKCSYVSHDYLDACRKCSIDLVDFKTQMQLHSIKAGDINLVACLSDMNPNFATASLQDTYFASSMLGDSDTGDAFDISLDDDLNISPMSISPDESGDLSRILFPAKPSADDGTTPSEPFDRGSLGPPQSGYATIMLDVSGFNAKPSAAVGDTSDPSTQAVDHPEPGDDAGNDATKPLNSPATAYPTGAADITWHEDTTAADELPPLDASEAFTYELSSAEVSHLVESGDPALPLHGPNIEETNSDASSDTEIPTLLDFDIDAYQSGIPPEEETLLDDICIEELLPELPDDAIDAPSPPVALTPQAETFIETFETLHAESVLPDLPIPEIEHTTTKVPSFDEATVVDEDVPSLELDNTVTPEEATLVDDRLAADIGLNFDTDPLDSATWQLPPYPRTNNDPDETSSEDEGAKPKDAD